jgi:hypothetical protein
MMPARRKLKNIDLQLTRPHISDYEYYSHNVKEDEMG